MINFTYNGYIILQEKNIKDWIISKGKEPTIENAKNLFRRHGVRNHYYPEENRTIIKTKKGEIISDLAIGPNWNDWDTYIP